MKKLTALLPLLVFLCVSCSPASREVDPAEFNAKISGRKDIASIDVLIRLYYFVPPEEAQPSLSIGVKEKGDEVYEADMVIGHLEDDSQSGLRIVMTAWHRPDKTWEVRKIRESWRCWKGRGHTRWGTSPCS